MTDQTTNTVSKIVKNLENCHHDRVNTGDLFDVSPLVFHYDSTFNVGDLFMSILTLRDPTKARLGKKRI